MVSARRGSPAGISDEAIADALARSPVPVVSAYLFGSHAEDRAHRESDVDIGVLLPQAGPSRARDAFDARVELTSHLIGQIHHNEVDVVILNSAPPQLARRIVTRGRRVVCTDRAADHAFVRDVQMRAADLDPFPAPHPPREARPPAEMTYLVERLAELRRHLAHLRDIRPRVRGPEALGRDLSLRNDVLFSLLTVCQLVVDIAAELSARRGARFEDYTEAVRSLSSDERFPADLVRKLERLPGFRNVLIHQYVALDMNRVMEALDDLELIDRFADIVTRIESE
jgi:uncharacterized protein YutE (UPF0331/DUF86 family)/predicted nucleotidyltransferase